MPKILNAISRIDYFLQEGTEIGKQIEGLSTLADAIKEDFQKTETYLISKSTSSGITHLELTQYKEEWHEFQNLIPKIEELRVKNLAQIKELEAMKLRAKKSEERNSKQNSNRLCQRDIRVLDRVSGSGLAGYIRPTVYFKDGSSFNTYNHRALLLGSVVASWRTDQEVEITMHDTLRGIDPYQLTNITLGSKVWGHRK